jgi:hypothetical protein
MTQFLAAPVSIQKCSDPQWFNSVSISMVYWYLWTSTKSNCYWLTSMPVQHFECISSTKNFPTSMSCKKKQFLQPNIIYRYWEKQGSSIWSVSSSNKCTFVNLYLNTVKPYFDFEPWYSFNREELKKPFS